MSGAEVAQLVTSGFDFFQTCIKIIRFCYTAQHIGADGDNLRTKLQWEHYRLVEWGERAGLGPSGTPRDAINWSLVNELLEQLAVFMTSSEKLEARFNLNVTEEALTEQQTMEADQPPAKGIGKFINRLRPDIYTQRGKIIQARNGMLRRLAWTGWGKDQTVHAVEEIHGFIERLYQLLDSAERKEADRVKTALLRDILSRCTSTQEVENIQDLLFPHPSHDEKAIKAAASLKSLRLLLGSDKRNDEIKPAANTISPQDIPELRKMDINQLKPRSKDSEFRETGVELAIYHGKPAIVEWKIAQFPNWGRYKSHVQKLALLLSNMDQMSFHSLRCQGYAPWESQERYALIYEFPGGPNSLSKSTEQEIRSCYDLMQQQPILSLTRRIEIAQKMAEAVLQLHTAGWLHKSLRSENIIFIADKSSLTKNFAQHRPFLVGYDYSRPDTKEGALLTQLSRGPLRMDLYRHPLARGIARLSYRKSFDLYSLGCMFLELALWQPLVEILSNLTQSDWLKRLDEAEANNQSMELPSFEDIESESALMEEVRYRAGTRFADAILLCFSAPFETQMEDVSLSTQQAILDTLVHCSC